MMVEVEITRPIWNDGRPVKTGSVVSLDAATASYLIGTGRAVRVIERAEPAPRPTKSGKGKG